MRERHFIAVYIMASARGGVIYIGVTSTLIHRVRQHREGALPGFTRRYGCKRLVWYQAHESIAAAIRHEKLIKHYVRAWKTNLIECDNPNWDDLYPDLLKACGLSDAYPSTPGPENFPPDLSPIRHPRARPEDPPLGRTERLDAEPKPSSPNTNPLCDGRGGSSGRARG